MDTEHSFLLSGLPAESKMLIMKYNDRYHSIGLAQIDVVFNQAFINESMIRQEESKVKCLEDFQLTETEEVDYVLIHDVLSVSPLDEVEPDQADMMGALLRYREHCKETGTPTSHLGFKEFLHISSGKDDKLKLLKNKAKSLAAEINNCDDLRLHVLLSTVKSLTVYCVTAGFSLFVAKLVKAITSESTVYRLMELIVDTRLFESSMHKHGYANMAHVVFSKFPLSDRFLVLLFERYHNREWFSIIPSSFGRANNFYLLIKYVELAKTKNTMLMSAIIGSVDKTEGSKSVFSRFIFPLLENEKNIKEVFKLAVEFSAVEYVRANLHKFSLLAVLSSSLPDLQIFEIVVNEIKARNIKIPLAKATSLFNKLQVREYVGERVDRLNILLGLGALIPYEEFSTQSIEHYAVFIGDHILPVADYLTAAQCSALLLSNIKCKVSVDGVKNTGVSRKMIQWILNKHPSLQERIFDSPIIMLDYTDIMLCYPGDLNKNLNALITIHLSEFRDISWLVDRDDVDLTSLDLRVVDICAASMNLLGLEALLSKKQISSRLTPEKMQQLREIVTGTYVK